jgi:hypothetical protein
MSREVAAILYCHNHLISLVILDFQRKPLMHTDVTRREIWEWRDHTHIKLLKPYITQLVFFCISRLVHLQRVIDQLDIFFFKKHALSSSSISSSSGMSSPGGTILVLGAFVFCFFFCFDMVHVYNAFVFSVNIHPHEHNDYLFLRISNPITRAVYSSA